MSMHRGNEKIKRIQNNACQKVVNKIRLFMIERFPPQNLTPNERHIIRKLILKLMDILYLENLQDQRKGYKREMEALYETWNNYILMELKL